MQKTLVYVLQAFLISCFISAKSFAEEVDDYIDNPRSEKSSSELNRLINDQFKEFTRFYKKSAKSKDCSKKEILELAIGFLDKNFTVIGNTLRDEVPKYKIKYKSRKENEPTVYANTDVKFCCTTTVNVNDIVIGIDKIDHFFGNAGLLIEEKIKNPAVTERELLEKNLAQENGGFGLSYIKVKSYGDLNANWSGINFYSNLVDGDKPLMSCENGQLKMNREFKMEDYVHPGWSDSINCPAFPTEQRAVTYANNLKRMKLQCPRVQSECEKLIELYPDPFMRSSLVSPVCLNKIDVSKSVESPVGISFDDVKNAAGGVRVKDFKKAGENLIKGTR